MAEHKQPMGIGKLGNASLIIKRKFRWTLEINTLVSRENRDGDINKYRIPEHFVSMASRPQLELDQTELNFLNGVTWLPGKGRWQPLSVTYIDTTNKEMQSLYNWIALVYGHQNELELKQGEKIDWNADAILRMYSGCGNEIERWTLGSVWPQTINFGDLSNDTSDYATIELTLKFSEAKLEGGTSDLNPSDNQVKYFGCTQPVFV